MKKNYCKISLVGSCLVLVVGCVFSLKGESDVLEGSVSRQTQPEQRDNILKPVSFVDAVEAISACAVTIEVTHSDESGRIKIADMDPKKRYRFPSPRIPKEGLGKFGEPFFDDPGNQGFQRSPRQEFPNQAPENGRGSGFVISSDGYILTNYHVVKNGGEIKIIFADGKEFAAKHIGSDEMTDLAVLKIDAENIPAASFGDSDALRVGESVIAVGTPFGLDHSVTSGIISALGRTNLNITQLDNLIQTDASVNPGNSGGPLVNNSGEVIGVNVAIYSPSGGNVGLGFAVPAKIAQQVANQLIENGEVRRGVLGVEVSSPSAGSEAGGAVVRSIDRGSAAEEAGLRVGDIITGIGNQAVDSAEALRLAVSLLSPSEPVSISVIREGNGIEMACTLHEAVSIEEAELSRHVKSSPGEDQLPSWLKRMR